MASITDSIKTIEKFDESFGVALRIGSLLVALSITNASIGAGIQSLDPAGVIRPANSPGVLHWQCKPLTPQATFPTSLQPFVAKAAEAKQLTKADFEFCYSQTIRHKATQFVAVTIQSPAWCNAKGQCPVQMLYATRTNAWRETGPAILFAIPEETVSVELAQEEGATWATTLVFDFQGAKYFWHEKQNKMLRLDSDSTPPSLAHTPSAIYRSGQ